MKTGKTIFRIILIVLLIGAIAALGAFAFRSGMTYGLAQNMDWSAVQEGTPAFNPMVGYYPHRFVGFGFFHLLGGVFFFFLFVGLLRMIFFPLRRFGHRHTGFRGIYGSGRCWDGKSVPPMVEEWHRRMHGEEPVEKNEKEDQAS